MLLMLFPSPPHPGSVGLVGRKGERVRVMCDGNVIEVWEWVERIPLNPADLQCTDFVQGWKLMRRENSPVPSADELAHFSVQ